MGAVIIHLSTVADLVGDGLETMSLVDSWHDLQGQAGRVKSFESRGGAQ